MPRPIRARGASPLRQCRNARNTNPSSPTRMITRPARLMYSAYSSIDIGALDSVKLGRLGSAGRGHGAVHGLQHILDRVEQLRDIGLEEAADRADPERVDRRQLSRINNHTTVGEAPVKLGECKCR